MRRAASLTLTLALLLCAVLTGCGSLEDAEIVEHRCGNLSILLPNYFSDRTEDSTSSATDQNMFVYTFQDITIFGIEEPFTLFEQGEAMTLEEYANQVISGNGLNCQIQTKDGYTYFLYDNETVNGKGTTWISVVLRSDTAFWLIQEGCADNHFSDNEADLWSYIKSIEFDKPEPVEPST